MGDNYKKILEANSIYSENFGNKSELPAPPKRKIAILTCMDARMIPESFAGLEEGDAHIFRNAGGRASEDAIRSLVISYKLGATNEWYVIHHTDCAVGLFTNEIMVKSFSHEDDEPDKVWPDFEAAKKFDWMTFRDPVESLIEDVKIIRNHPLVPGYIPIYGFVFDVKTGELVEVEEANKAGLPVEAKTSQN